MIDTKKMYLCLLNGEMRHTSMLVGTHFDGCEYAHYECAILQLCDEVDKLRAELAAEWEKNRWIPCSERLPEDHVKVLFLYENGSTRDIYHGDHIKSPEQWMTTGGFYFHRLTSYNLITHWRELPAPPEKK